MYKDMTRQTYLVIISAVFIGLLVSLSPLVTRIDKNLLSHYLKFVTPYSEKNNLIVVKVDKEVVKENKLWPWGQNWFRYLISFLIDLKPQKLILGSELVNSVSDLKFVEEFHTRNILAIPAYEGKTISFPGKVDVHLKIWESKGYYYSFLNYKNIPVLKIKPQFNIKNNKFYFLPVDNLPEVISAQDIALTGFLRGEEFKGLDLSKIRGKVVLLEVEGPSLFKEASLLYAQLNNSFFYFIPRELSIYFGIFVFVVLFILCRRFKFRIDIGIYFIFMIGIMLLHLGYFHAHRSYFEVTPLVVFAFLGFVTALVEREIRAREDRKYKKEMQIARLLKEKEILPVANISSDGISVSIARYKMDKVGGDFYQFLEFNKGELGVVLGWVPDEGMERVKYIIEVIHGWRDFATVYKEPGKVVQVLNNSLFRFAEQGKYATLIYMLFDAKKSVLKYVNAGHDPFIILRSNGFTRVIEAQDPTPVGIARDISFKEEEITLYSGDSVIAFSGGISKIIQEKEGIKREFLDAVKSHLGCQPQEFCNHIFNSVVKTYYPQRPNEEWFLLTMRVE